jgi:hypothetical protein
MLTVTKTVKESVPRSHQWSKSDSKGFYSTT